jgi:hypothetical protein
MVYHSVFQKRADGKTIKAKLSFMPALLAIGRKYAL